MNGAAYDKCLKINAAFDVLDIPPHQRVAILASNVFCAETTPWSFVQLDEPAARPVLEFTE